VRVTKVIEAVTIGYQPSWEKWPDTLDMGFDSVMAKRQDGHYTINGEPVTVRMRWYPVHRTYIGANIHVLPVQHPFIVNTMPPPQPVLDWWVRDLEALAASGVTLVLWEHAYQCYPPVAQHLKRLFKHSILIHGDDCPGSTEIKTAPIAQYFDSVFHGNLIWTAPGEKTADLYHRLGVQDTHYLTLGPTGGFTPTLPGGAPFDLDQRIQQLSEQRYLHDVVFAGSMMGTYRQRYNEPEATALFNAAGLKVKLYGVGMRDGPLVPRIPSTIGKPVGQLYAAAFSTVNIQFIGLISTRSYDAWSSGTLLVQYDPVHELDPIGILPGVHYAHYDGTVQGLINTVRYYQHHFDEAERILRAGYEIGPKLQAEYNMTRAVERVLAKFASKWS
jgi:hypothetical protein